jgi:hypothetical protein
MSDTVEIPIPDFATDGAVAKKSTPPKAALGGAMAAAPGAPVLDGLSLNAALAEIESARVTQLAPRKPKEKAKRPPPKYVRKRP